MTALTHVELLWVKDRIENRIRFGTIAEHYVLDRSRQLVSFEPGSVLPSFVGPPILLSAGRGWNLGVICPGPWKVRIREALRCQQAVRSRLPMPS